MSHKMLIAGMIGLLLGGCIDLDFDLDLSEIRAEMRFMPGASLHPLYEEDDLIFEEKLLGTWVDKMGSPFVFEKAEETNTYVLTISDANMQGKFVAYLVKIDGMLFLDITPDNPAPDKISLQQMLYIPGHMFMKI